MTEPDPTPVNAFRRSRRFVGARDIDLGIVPAGGCAGVPIRSRLWRLPSGPELCEATALCQWDLPGRESLAAEPPVPGHQFTHAGKPQTVLFAAEATLFHIRRIAPTGMAA